MNGLRIPGIMVVLAGLGLPRLSAQCEFTWLMAHDAAAGDRPG